MVVSAMRLALIYIAIAALAALIIAPGLTGGFVLDDYPNLALLSQLPENPTWDQIFSLLQTGIAGMFGRPMAMFTFFLQAEAWPGNPFAFKLVNLLIHLINGALVFLFCLLLGKSDTRYQLLTPLLVFAVLVWLIHPIQITAVLYVVQRMNLLSAMFVLLGLCAYMTARLLYFRHGHKSALVLMLAAPIIAGALAMLGKENGVLIFAYIAVLEFTLLPVPQQDRLFQRLRLAIIAVPMTALVIGAIAVLPQVLPSYDQKPFTLFERILTEFPVLLSYLAAIALPRQSAYGLFHDNFPVYSSLLALPVLLSVVFFIGAVTAALYYRKRWPLGAFALLWFLAGHAMESTVIPLELYFEFRNYLPLLGIVFALAWLIQHLWKRLDEVRQMLVPLIVGLFSLWLGFVSVQQSTLWGDPLEHAYAEVYFRPDSPRARANLVQTLSNNGQADVAFDIHRQTLLAGSDRIADYMRWLEFTCILPDIERPSMQQLTAIAGQSGHDYSVIGTLNNLLPAVLQGGCPAVNLNTLNRVMEALIDNPLFELSRPDLLQMRAVTAAANNNLGTAAQLAGQSYDLRANEGVGLMRMRWLLDAGAVEQAAAMLARYRSDFGQEIRQRAGLANQIRLIEQRLAELGN